MSSGEAENTAKSPAEPAAPSAFSLDTILSDKSETLEHPDFKDKSDGGWDEESTEHIAAEGFCIECEGEHPSFPHERTHPDERSDQTNPHSCIAKIA